MDAQPTYLPDNSIDEVLDRELRGLLTTCFTKPEAAAIFKTRRFYREPCPHHWIIRDERGALVAHIEAHEKAVESEGRRFRSGGIGAVCVHPACRGRGFARTMLATVHDWLTAHDYVFAILFGAADVYGSSGYVDVSNLFHGSGNRGRQQVNAMVRELSKTPWPAGAVYLPGPTF